ncbi:MAG: LacI family DNA-binding transcriptional regulator [Phycisphaerae bacterium]
MNHISGQEKVTLDDIARAAGCSKNTASLALRNSKRISLNLRTRIHTIADQLHYTTNSAARNLRARRSGMIGIYTGTLCDAVRTELVNHLLAELHTAEYHPVLGVGQGHSESWYSSPWMQTFRELRVEALVVLWEKIDKLPEWSRSIPIILVGCEPNENFPCDYLALDRQQAGELGIEHLLSRGHRKILVGAFSNSDFAQGCRKKLNAVHCKPYQSSFDINYADISQARLAGYTLAQNKIPPTAALFHDSGYAANFIQGVLDAHRKVPGNIAVVGYDYFPWAQMLAVPLTTIEQPIGTMASMAVELIKRRLAQPESPAIHMVQPHTLVIRSSS